MKIVLIGFMGSGKSSLAPVLAAKLGLRAVEMDDLITDRAGRGIKDIFADQGEAAFRELETAVAQELSTIDGVVISTGGGVIGSDQAMTALSNNGVIVQLYAPFESLLKRIGDIPRPLFEDVEQAKQLYDKRQPLYDQWSDIRIDTDNQPISAVADQIIAKVGPA